MATETFDRDRVQSYGTIWSGRAQCRVENEYILPDYKEAAQRLVRVDVDPHVTGKNLYLKGQELVCEIEGVAFLHALYLPEGAEGSKNAASFTARENFFTTFHAPIPEGARPDPESIAVLCESSAENGNARLLGPRRISVKSDVVLRLDLRGNQEITFYSGSLPEDMELLTRESETTVLVSTSRQEFRLTEKLELPAEYLPIRDLVDLDFTLFADRVRALSGAVEFTGHLYVNASYAPEGESGILGFCQPIEFEKSVGEAAAEEGDLCEVTMTPTVFQTSVEMGESGENKILVLDVAYTAEINLFRRKKISYCSDLYSVRSDLDFHTGEVRLDQMIAVKDFARDLTESFPLHHAPFTRAEDLRATLTFQNSYREENKLKVEAALALKYLALSDNGEITGAEDSLDLVFDLPEEIELPQEDGRVEITGGVSDVELALQGEEVSVRFGVFGRVSVFREEAVQMVTELSRGEDKKCSDPGLLFHYPDGEESLWEICKHYRVRRSQVRQENGLEGDQVPGVIRITLK